MKGNFNLEAVLEKVAVGKVSVSNAKNIIETYFSENTDHNSDEGNPLKTKGFKGAIDKIKKSGVFEEILKKSNQIVQQISENMPQKIQDNFGPIGFSANTEGVDSKLSVFREVDVSLDNIVQSNQVVGCQWFGVVLSGHSEIKNNKFIAMQLNEFSLVGSDMCDSHFSLSRMNHVSLQESCFVKNKFTLSTWADTSMSESDFTENVLNRCDFSGTVINASRLSKVSFANVGFKECEFDECDIQGIEFENCEFKDCSFRQIVAVATEPIKVSGVRLTDKQFSNCQTVEEFVEMLKEN